MSVRGPGRRRMYSVTYPSATTSVERTTASERDVIIVPRITCERGPDRMSGHLAKKGCAWLGQERQQAPYAPRHWALKTGCRWDRWAGRTRLPSPRRARISASAWIPGWDRKRTGSCNCRLQMHSAGTCDLSLTRAQKGRMHIDCSHVLDAVGVFNWSSIADGYKIQLRGCKCHVWSVG